MPQPFPVNANYLTVIRGLLRMHQLSVNGQFDSPAADAIRDAMDVPWEGLSEVERRRLGGLSEDLNTLETTTENRAPAEMNPQAQGKLNQAYEARQQGEWDRALELLRRWGRHAPPALISYLRGTIWRQAGDAETAAVFFEHACRLDPENDNYRTTLLRAMKTADPEAALSRAEAVLRDDSAQTPVAVIYAADIVFASTRKGPEPEATSTCNRLIPILERTLVRLQKEEDVDSPALMGTAFMLLAITHRRLGDTRSAYDYFSRAIRLYPADDILLTARGILVYGTDARAVADFEQAVHLRSSLAWPFLYLADYYLSCNRFEDARMICERGLRRRSSARVQSELYEFLAIAQAGLGYPEGVISAAFESAIRADPSNDRARRNLERFEEALSARAPQPKDWERQSESSLRMLGLEEVCSDDVLCASREPALV